MRKLITKNKRDVILNRTKDHYENDKERVRKHAQKLIWEKKIKRENMEKSRYHSMSEDKNQRLKKCQKNYRETKKSQSNQ